MVVGSFGFRSSSQGVMTSASRNLLLLWFGRLRGLVSGVSGVFVYLGFSLAPLLLAMLIEGWQWRAALWWLAVLVGPLFALLCFWLVRDRAEVCSLQPDNQPATSRMRRQLTSQDSHPLKLV